MLLLITGSADGTADRIVHKYDGDVFRLNFDILSEYEVAFSEHRWEIRNPSGHAISSETVRGAFWWKAFAYWNPDVGKHASAEARYLCRDLYGWCMMRGMAIGNSPDFHNRFGKMTILGAAAEFFSVPKTLTTMKMSGVEQVGGSRVVAKSLSSETSEDKKVLHTTEVDTTRLHSSYVWYLQEAIESDWDVTVFYCNQRCFGFKRDRTSLKGLDWRAEQQFDFSEQEWFPHELTMADEHKLCALSQLLGVEFGRYDFMLNKDNELVFLELNANGQWVFLDIEDKYSLLDSVVEWLKFKTCSR